MKETIAKNAELLRVIIDIALLIIAWSTTEKEDDEELIVSKVTSMIWKAFRKSKTK